MSEKQGKQERDIFVTNRTFPTAINAFKSHTKALEDIKDTCCVVFDTNVLLIPFTISNSSLGQIKGIYEKLAMEKRLFIPGQVAREFAQGRPFKISDINKNILDTKSKLKNLKIGKYPLLEELQEYKELLSVEEDLENLLKTFSQKIDAVLKQIQSWNWNDPVSIVYNDVFTEDCVIDISFYEEKIKKELEFRSTHNLPPGYKDKGPGDLLIWKTVLEIGKSNSNDVIFVSGDVKADWWHGSNNKNLYPRYELIDEFRRHTNEKTLHIIEFSTLLNLYGAPTPIVDEVKNQEIIHKTINWNNLYRNYLSHVTRNAWEEVFTKSLNESSEKLIDSNKTKYIRIKFKKNYEDTLIKKMLEWFFENYEDPSNGVPYDGQAGGYQYINGGPYDPIVVLSEKFAMYSPELIEKAADVIYENGSEWVKIGDY